METMVKGVRCGNHGREGRFYHADAAEVRACYAWDWDNEENARAEQAVELAYERHLEDRGYDEARFQEQMEARFPF
jgi:hypothetical protein